MGVPRWAACIYFSAFSERVPIFRCCRQSRGIGECLDSQASSGSTQGRPLQRRSTFAPPPMDRCALFWSKLDSHFRGPAQRRGPNARTLVHYHPALGFGDEMSGFLASVAVAVASQRRLEIAPLNGSSYLSAGFISAQAAPHDFEYTGSTKALTLVPRIISGFESMVRNCVSPPAPNRSQVCATAWCCVGSSHLLPRPLDFLQLSNFPKPKMWTQ